MGGNSLNMAGRLSRIPILGGFVIFAANLKFFFSASVKSGLRQVYDIEARLATLAALQELMLPQVAKLEQTITELALADRALDLKVDEIETVRIPQERKQVLELEQAYLGLNHIVREELVGRLELVRQASLQLADKIEQSVPQGGRGTTRPVMRAGQEYPGRNEALACVGTSDDDHGGLAVGEGKVFLDMSKAIGEYMAVLGEVRSELQKLSE